MAEPLDDGLDSSDRPAEQAMPCFGRQPILDERGRVFGYELFYRRSGTPVSDDTTLAGARILSDVIGKVGLETLSGGRPVFLQFSRDLLLNGGGTLLPPAALVIELDHDVTVDDPVVEACRRLSEAGYAIGLDSSMVGERATVRLMPYAKFIKVDVALTTAPRRSTLVGELRAHGVRLIAESVETPELAAEVRAAGYRLFQGRYFCAPVTVGSARIVGTRAAYLHLLGALNRVDLSVAELEDLIKHDASLCYRVLQSVNSAVFGLRREIWSIRQAIVLLGHDQIRKWASVWAMSEINVVGVDEMLSLALVRARACELLGEHIADEDERPGCFLLGLCSLLDVLTGRTMMQILDELPLPRSIKDALLGRRGRLRSILDVVVAYEQGDWDGATRAVDEAGVTGVVSLPDVYLSALTWVPGLRSART